MLVDKKCSKVFSRRELHYLVWGRIFEQDSVVCSFPPFRVLGITCLDDGGDVALKTVVGYDANLLVVCVREAEWFNENLIHPMGRVKSCSFFSLWIYKLP